MEKLKERFTKNGLPYTLIKRNDKVAMYGVGGTFTTKILHYEVCQIYTNKEKSFNGRHFPESESLPGNEQFGRDKSRAILNYREALTYFDYLTELLDTPVERGAVSPLHEAILTHRVSR